MLVPTAIRPSTKAAGDLAIDRLRAAKRASDARAAAALSAPVGPLEAAPVGLDEAQQSMVAAAAGARAAAEAAGARRGTAEAWLRSLPRLRTAMAAAIVLMLAAGVGVLTAAGRGALAASTTAPSRGPGTGPELPGGGTAGISGLLDPSGVLDSPAAEKLMDARISRPIDSTPYRIVLGGVPRYFRIHFPGDVAPRTPRPLILVLPGLLLTARDAEAGDGFDQLSDTAGVTIAYLDGVHNSWDAGTCCGYAAAAGLDDVGALHVTVDALARLVRVDRRHIVLAGFSNGAMLAYRAACTQSAQLAGLIVASGSLQVSRCQPKPVSIVVGHGRRDNTVPVEGSPDSVYLRSPVTSLAASLAPFERADGCSKTAVLHSGRYAVTRLTDCAAGVTVTTYLDGLGGHAWLGQVPVPGVVGGQTFAYTAWQQLGGRASAVPFSP